MLYDGRVEGEAVRAEALSKQILEICIDAGGSITGEHGVGTDKACAMPLMFGEDDLAAMQRLRRFARYWDLVGNSGNFLETAPLIWSKSASPFAAFSRWSDWLYARVGRQSGIALPRLAELLFEFLTGELALNPTAVARALWRDYRRGGRTDKPSFLRDHIPEAAGPSPRRSAARGCKRQARHLAQVTPQ